MNLNSQMAHKIAREYFWLTEDKVDVDSNVVTTQLDSLYYSRCRYNVII